MLGQCYPNGEAPALGRVAALDAGLGVGVPGLQLDRRCGSGLQAVLMAAMQVQTGVADVVLAGGAESMSQVEYYVPGIRWGTRAEIAGPVRPPCPGPGHRRRRELPGARGHAGDGREPAPGVRDLPRRSRTSSRCAVHERAVAAQTVGPVRGRDRPGHGAAKGGRHTVVDTDEHPGRTPPWSRWPRCGRCAGARTRRPP